MRTNEKVVQFHYIMLVRMMITLDTQSGNGAESGTAAKQEGGVKRSSRDPTVWWCSIVCVNQKKTLKM